MDSHKPQRHNVLVSFLLGMVAYGMALAASQSVAASDLELWTYDFLVNHGGCYSKENDNIIVVAFDDATVTHLGRFPIPRTVLADVIRRVSTAKPRIVGLDFFLSEPREPAEDAALQEALTDAGNVIVASQLGSGGLPGLEPIPFFCQTDSSGARGWCQENTPGAVGFAFVNMPVDNDGFVRSMLLLPPDAGGPVSLPLALAQQYSGEPIRPATPDAAQFLGRRIPYLDADRKTVLIAWNPEPAKLISALSILQDKVDLEKLFGDKLVLIGQSSDAARDRFFTPVFRPRSRDGSRILLPGVEVHAAAIHTLLHGPVISVLSPTLNWGILFLLVWFVTWLTIRMPLKFGLSAAVIALLALYGAAQGLMAFQHYWMKVVGGEAALLLVPPVSATYQFVQERFSRSLAEADREQIMGMFSRYVSPEVAQRIWERKNEIVLAGEERTATLLFSDIRSFTALSAGKPSQQVLGWLNRYFTAMDEVITRENGFLNKFMGDGLMVIFGVPLSGGVNEDACCAVRCALGMLKKVEELNAEQSAHGGDPPIQIGIGIHTGPLTCGSVGSEKRLEYSVIGETVNLASRLESLTKDLHVPIVMSESTEQLIREHFKSTRDLGQTKIRGFDGEIHVYTVESLDRSPVVAQARG
ncbi:MAG TPA: adenylate/guanylate cyclase domain-containing protein [Terriglobales bacterium]|nr:adenylate/guanylate cyclase domain-containing protein [Terriglobales bacterium]